MVSSAVDVNMLFSHDAVDVLFQHQNTLNLLMINFNAALVTVFVDQKMNKVLSGTFKNLLTIGELEDKKSLFSVYQAAKKLSNKFAINLILTGIENSNDIIFMAQNVAGVSTKHQHKTYLLEAKNQSQINEQLAQNIERFLKDNYPLHDALVLAIAAGKSNKPAHIVWNDNIADYPFISEIAEDSVNINSKGVNFDDFVARHKNSTLVETKKYSFLNTNNQIGIYPVVDNLAHLETLLEAGAKTIQLRIKTASSDPLLPNIIAEAVALGKQYHAHLYINDHWPLAITSGAYGIHLGQEDCMSADLRAIADASIRLGVSCHSFFEMLLAIQLSPSYIALGHIFPTTTKSMPSAPQGLLNLTRYVTLIDDQIPTVAIGGINYERINAVKNANVSGIAIVRAITEADCPKTAFHQLNSVWQQDSGIKHVNG